jgi:hypothetical protein
MWDFSFAPKRTDLIKRLYSPWTTEDGKAKVTEIYTDVDDVLWTIDVVDDKKFIGCYLLKHVDGKGWTFYPMIEQQNPPVFNCPLAFLDLASDEKNKDWRAKVKEWHKRANNNAKSKRSKPQLVSGDALTKGMVVMIKGNYKNPGPFLVVRLEPEIVGYHYISGDAFKLPPDKQYDIVEEFQDARAS